MFAIEGLGRQLYPDLDLWSTARPYLEKWVREQMGPLNSLRRLRQQHPYWVEDLAEVPLLMHRVLKHLDHEQRQGDAKTYSTHQEHVHKRDKTSELLFGMGSVLLVISFVLMMPFDKVISGLVAVGTAGIVAAWFRK